MLLTIVELPEYQRKIADLLSSEDNALIINYLAAHPATGVVMQGTGGIRKLRWAREGRGKSGGIRVIYYFHNETMPLFLLTAFGKSEKPNLSKVERNELAKLARLLTQSYIKRI